MLITRTPIRSIAMGLRVSLAKMGFTGPCTMNLGPPSKRRRTISSVSKVQVSEFENGEVDKLLLYSAGSSAKE